MGVKNKIMSDLSFFYRLRYDDLLLQTIPQTFVKNVIFDECIYIITRL